MVVNSAASPVSTGDLAVAERQVHTPFEDEEPVTTGVDPLFGTPSCGFEAHPDGDGAAGRSVEHPGRALAGGARGGTYHHVLVSLHVEERVEFHLERRGQREQDVQADRSFAGFDPADGGCAEVGTGGELVERQAEGLAETAQLDLTDEFQRSLDDVAASDLLLSEGYGATRRSE